MSDMPPPTVSDTRREEFATPRPAAAPTTPVAPGTAVSRTTTTTYSPAYRLVQLIWLLDAVTIVILGLRVLFRAIAANDTGFVSFIYTISYPLAWPFESIKNDVYLTGSHRHPLDVGALIAAFVYLVAAFIVVRLIRILTAPRTTTTV